MTKRSDSAATRRQFLLAGGAVFLGSATTGGARRTAHAGVGAAPAEGLPEATQEGPGPQITTRTIREAEKLANVRFTDEQREVIRQTIHNQLHVVQARHAAPLPPNGLAPATVFNPRLNGRDAGLAPQPLHPVWTEDDPGPVPGNDEDIAFAPVTRLSQWIRRREIKSRDLTELYLDRLRRFDPELQCVITRTDALARQQADQADREIRAGHIRGPLHGIPWGAKDLLDTAAIPTTWGARPYRDRVPGTDAAVVRRLRDAGAVLLAKLSLGALAYGDRWFDGDTKNPWNPEIGSSGSSAGSAAATAAGLVAFSVGSETYGSILSPSMRCGVTGLRPTFGRVDRTGAMALSWSMDKLGPITRTVEDAIMVLHAIHGPTGPHADEPADPAVVDEPLIFDAFEPIEGLRVGYDPRWFDHDDAKAPDEQMLDHLADLGVELVEITMPRLPYQALEIIIFAEAAAAFEHLTITGRDEELRWQDPTAWPNVFRRSRFLSAVDYVQAQRFRRQVMAVYDDLFRDVDVLAGPTYADWLLLASNATGHPALTLRTGYLDDGQPHGSTMIGRLYDEGTLGRLGSALEHHLNIWPDRPPL